MVFIAWNKAVCIFPRSTFIHRRSFTTQSHFLFHNQFWTWAKRLVDNGFHVFGEGENIELTCNDTQTQRRQVGDGLTWTIDFDINGEIHDFK
jgi:hypothetical protein